MFLDMYNDGNIGLYKKYKTIITKFNVFLKKEKFSINAFTYEVVKNYEKYLLQKLHNKTNTVTSNMKILSKFVRNMYKENKLDFSLNPFNDYKMKFQATTRTYLTLKDLKKIESYQFIPTNPLYDARDIFVFECYTGIRIADILTLKWENHKDDEISFTIRKTKKKHSITLSDVAKRIIEKRRSILDYNKLPVSPQKYIFNILKENIETMHPEDIHNAISSATASINKKLKTIAKKVGINKCISTHIYPHNYTQKNLL